MPKNLSHSPKTLPEAIERLIQSDGASTSGSFGRIVMTPDGRPIRSIITGRRHIVTGSYPSRKSRCAMPHESMNELAFFHESEVDTRVVDYRAQPFRLEFILAGQLRTYIPDCARLLSDGTVEVVEIKSDYRALSDEDYAEKLRAVREFCHHLGWRFRIVVREDTVAARIRQANVHLIQSKRTVSYLASHYYVAFDLLDRLNGEASLAQVAQAFGDSRLGTSIAMAMMVGRTLDIELGRPISADSRVVAVDDAEFGEGAVQ